MLSRCKLLLLLVTAEKETLPEPIALFVSAGLPDNNQYFAHEVFILNEQFLL